MDSINKKFKIRLSLVIALALLASVFAHMNPASEAALSAPTVKSGKVEVGSTANLTVSKNKKCSIKTLEAYSGSPYDLKVVKATKSSITVKGLKAANARVYVYIVYKYPKKREVKTLKMIDVKVFGGAASPTPVGTATPGVTPSAKPTETPKASVTPSATPKVSATPSATPGENPPGPLKVYVVCNMGLGNTDFPDMIKDTDLGKAVKFFRISDGNGHNLSESVTETFIDKVTYRAYHDEPCSDPYEDDDYLWSGRSFIKVIIKIKPAYVDLYGSEISGSAQVDIKEENLG